MRNTQANVTSKTQIIKDFIISITVSPASRKISHVSGENESFLAGLIKNRPQRFDSISHSARISQKKIIDIIFFLVSLTWGTAGFASSPSSQTKMQTNIVMSDDSIVDLIQKQSFSFREQSIKKESLEAIEQATLLPYRWSFNLDSSREEDRTDSTSTFTSPNSLKYRNAVTFSKKFNSGTSLQFDFQNIDYRTGNSVGDYNLNGLIASLEQNLYPFLQTNTDQILVENARIEKDRALLQWSSDKITSLRNVMSLYWQIKALNVSVIENASVFKKYENLVTAVKRKKSNNFATAGELEQAYAEYLAREQQLKEDQNSLSQKLSDLRSELGLTPETALEIDLKLKPAKMPEPRKFQIGETSPVQIQRLKYLYAKNLADVAETKDNGRLSLYGKANPIGVDGRFSDSWNEFSQSDKNKYTVGIKFDYIIDDSGAVKDADYKKAAKLLELNRLQELELQMGDQVELQYKNLSIGYQAIQNSAEIVDNRVAALESIAKSYQQGRMDISNLIDAYNKMVTSKVNLYKAYGAFYDKWWAYQQIFTDLPAN